MAVIKVAKGGTSIARAIDYVDKKAELTSGINCSDNGERAKEEMLDTKEIYNKMDGRQYKHYIQSFKPNETTEEQAHKIGRELGEKFKAHEVFIATHTDKEHIHNHLILNSVSFENGSKFQQSKRDLVDLKKFSDQICYREGLSVIKEKSKNITTFDQEKYKAIEKGFSGKEPSYLLDTAQEVSKSLALSTNKQEFTRNMELKKYKVNWTENRKYITFTTPNNKKIRNNNLEKTFKEIKFSKEGMENELQRNRRSKQDRLHSNRDYEREQRTEIKRDGEQPSETALDGVERRLRTVKENARGFTPSSRAEQRERQRKLREHNERISRESKQAQERIDRITQLNNERIAEESRKAEERIARESELAERRARRSYDHER